MTPRETEEVRALYAGVERIMDMLDDDGRKIGGLRAWRLSVLRL